jgi:hypothetical protein
VGSATAKIREAQLPADEPAILSFINSKVKNLPFGPSRDFPDSVRKEGEEKF